MGDTKYDVYTGEPQDVTNYIYDDNYACALCKCPLPLNYGIVIDKKHIKPDEAGFYHFHCLKCDLFGCMKG